MQLEGSWRDVPMRFSGGEWSVKLALTEVGWFQAKAYAVDAGGGQQWPEGDNIGLSVHPNTCRSNNTIYCAFPRMFGPAKTQRKTAGIDHDPRIMSLDSEGYTVIPPGGTLRDLKAELPHILNRSIVESCICCPLIRRRPRTRGWGVLVVPMLAVI